MVKATPPSSTAARIVLVPGFRGKPEDASGHPKQGHQYSGVSTLPDQTKALIFGSAQIGNSNEDSSGRSHQDRWRLSATEAYSVRHTHVEEKHLNPVTGKSPCYQRGANSPPHDRDSNAAVLSVAGECAAASPYPEVQSTALHWQTKILDEISQSHRRWQTQGFCMGMGDQQALQAQDSISGSPPGVPRAPVHGFGRMLQDQL
ncbi:hypothetical protein V492_05801 [Pseudogymnoascus sp. VKM F-4246]|nr:hypothetical protein V492_05801 [Pseudogymnoascus sp. VKM F-4246]